MEKELIPSFKVQELTQLCLYFPCLCLPCFVLFRWSEISQNMYQLWCLAELDLVRPPGTIVLLEPHLLFSYILDFRSSAASRDY